jgi:hypothetical protein
MRLPSSARFGTNVRPTPQGILIYEYARFASPYTAPPPHPMCRNKDITALQS